MEKSNIKNQKKKPVILQVLPELRSGGVERGTIETVRYLSQNGFGAIVASSGGHLVSQIESAGGSHIILPLKSKNPFTIYTNIFRVSKVIKQYEIDIVHARSRAPAWSCYFACRRTKCHFLTTFHGTYSFKGSIKKFYNSVMVRGEKVIAISEFIKDHILKNYKVSRRDITVIPRGVDLDHFDLEKLPKRRIIQMAEKLGIEMDRPIILLPGRFTGWKGHEFLLEALALIPKDKYRCLFVGDMERHKSYVAKLNKKIKEMRLLDNVRMIKSTQDMPCLYSLVDIVVSASVRPEAFGRITIEAQAMERLVVATNHGGSVETIVDGQTGWLVEPGDVKGLAEILTKLLKINDKQRKTITNKAKKHVQENFSLGGMTQKTFEVYQSILGMKSETKEMKKEAKVEKEKPSEIKVKIKKAKKVIAK